MIPSSASSTGGYAVKSAGSALSSGGSSSRGKKRSVAVDPERRRRGIATRLLNELFERTDDPDEQYTLEVRQSNGPAIELYERFGFRPAGLRRRYYHDNKEDALIMWRVVAEAQPAA